MILWKKADILIQAFEPEIEAKCAGIRQKKSEGLLTKAFLAAAALMLTVPAALVFFGVSLLAVFIPIILALWVYQNARKFKLSAPVRGIITLFTNIAGVLVYLIYKHINGIRGFCGAV